MLYLETKALPLSHVVAVRRLFYCQNILKKDTNKIIKKVYTALKENLCKGDWTTSIEEDNTKYGINLSDEVIASTFKVD